MTRAKTATRALAIIAGVCIASGSYAANLEGPFIVGGREAQPGAWPWQVNLEQDDAPICGGSLIAPEWVLSAAHCFFDESFDGSMVRAPDHHFSVTLGDHDMSFFQEAVQNLPVAEVILHEGYDPDGEETAENGDDIALIRLARPATLNDRVQVVGLVTPGEEPTIAADGTIATATGWGDIVDRGPASKVLKQVDLPLLGPEACRAFDPDILDGMICAGGTGGEDTCQGDSGGPLVVPAMGTYKQVGIVSFGGDVCAAPNEPGVYTRVPYYIAWITQKTGLSFGSGPSGLQVTADGQLILINKPVGAERWAMTVNPDGSLTGNVFYTDGREPVFLDCARVGDDGNPDRSQIMIHFSCELSAKCSSSQCPGEADWMTVTNEFIVPGSFFLPRAPARTAALPQGAPAGEDQAELDRPAAEASQGSALQMTRDGQLTLINKPVGAERWAMTVNGAGRLTGNAFFTDGRDPTFIDCTRVGDDGNPDPARIMIRFSCAASQKCSSSQCPGDGDWQALPNPFIVPGSFLLPRTGG